MPTIKILPRMATSFSKKDVKCKKNVACDPSYRGRNKEFEKACVNFAKLVIDGTPMCLRHAQAEALKILLRQKP